MVTKEILFCIGLFVFLNTLNAQEDNSVKKITPRVIHFGDQLQSDIFYVGVDGRFVMSFANDSIIQARFFNVDRFDRYQKIHYRRSGDTIFLHNSSQPRVPYFLCTQEQIQNREGAGGLPAIVRFFYPKQSMRRGVVQEHLLMHEGIYYMDSISLQIYIPYKEVYCHYSDIIVVSHKNYFVRLCKDIDSSYYPHYDYLKIDMSNRYSLCHYALFNDFPLLVKGDSIFPIDNEKNYQCWIDNGFFFPIMIKGHDKPWEAKDIPYRSVGIEGIKFEF